MILLGFKTKAILRTLLSESTAGRWCTSMTKQEEGKEETDGWKEEEEEKRADILRN